MLKLQKSISSALYQPQMLYKERDEAERLAFEEELSKIPEETDVI